MILVNKSAEVLTSLNLWFWYRRRHTSQGIGRLIEEQRYWLLIRQFNYTWRCSQILCSKCSRWWKSLLKWTTWHAGHIYIYNGEFLPFNLPNWRTGLIPDAFRRILISSFLVLAISPVRLLFCTPFFWLLLSFFSFSCIIYI